MPFSIMVEVCLGNVVLLTKSRFSLIGLVILFSAFIDSFWFKSVKENIGFTSAMIDIVRDVCRRYGVSLFIACGAVVAAQTCVLLWWGVFFVGLIANASSGYAELLIVLMGVSLYWIANFFHAFMSFVVGGCVVWYFVKGSDEPLGAASRVLLHMQCGLTTNLGSICKVIVDANGYSRDAHLILQ
jgi:hypothetical protein